jgi:hypothetical protein
MIIIGCDFHTRYQQIARMDESTGVLVERRLDRESGEAHVFYRNLQGPARVGSAEAVGIVSVKRIWFPTVALCGRPPREPRSI